MGFLGRKGIRIIATGNLRTWMAKGLCITHKTNLPGLSVHDQPTRSTHHRRGRAEKKADRLLKLLNSGFMRDMVKASIGEEEFNRMLDKMSPK